MLFALIVRKEGDNMGDKRRFDLFANYIKVHFPNVKSVADIAGGKGYLQVALKEQGIKEVITLDKGKRCKRGINYKHQLLSNNTKLKNVNLLVGMHPDEATDVIITQASKRGIPFSIVPCCAKPTDTVFWGSIGNFANWLKHLKGYAERLGYRVEEHRLRMAGRNIVLTGRKV